jgi:hypothetical protein
VPPKSTKTTGKASNNAGVLVTETSKADFDRLFCYVVIQNNFIEYRFPGLMLSEKYPVSHSKLQPKKLKAKVQCWYYIKEMT